MKKLFTLWTAMLITCIASAQVSTWDGTWEPWTHGTGTETDPFLIENAQQLAYLAYRVNNGFDAGGTHISNHDYHYKLMVDVDLNGSEDFQWIPIGYWNSNTDYQCFGGCFDGDDHVVSGLFINSAANRVGFFGFINSANIEKLTVEGEKIFTTGSYSGGISGYAEGITSFYGCINNTNVSSSSEAGGVLGVNTGTTRIANCNNKGYVTAHTRSGGVLGATYGATTIMNSCNSGDVYTHYYVLDNYRYAGGILGCSDAGSNNTVVISCYNTGNSSIGSSGPHTVQHYSGGILGRGLSASYISNCYSIGGIAAPGQASMGCNPGGIVGCRSGGDVINSYYRDNCGGNNTYGGQPMSEDAMKSAEFVGILNNGMLYYKKDEEPYMNQGYPVFCEFQLVTMPVSDVTYNSALLMGDYSMGDFNFTTCGFEYKKVTDEEFVVIDCGIGKTPYSYALDGLAHSTAYHYRAFATAAEGKAYGELVEFTTAAPPSYTITASVNGGGTIDPSGAITINEGDSLTFHVTPNDNYVIQTVLVDGETVGDVSVYTFRDVRENHEIVAVFEVYVPPFVPPVNLMVEEVSDVNAWLSWEGLGDRFVVVYGVIGVFHKTVSTAERSIVLNGLWQNSDYEWKVKAIRGEEETEFAQGQPFRTLGTGVDESGALSVVIAPNPTNGNICIEASGLRHVTIFNALGQQVYDGSADGDTFEYCFSKHKAGIYLVRIETAKGVTTKRVAVTK